MGNLSPHWSWESLPPPSQITLLYKYYHLSFTFSSLALIYIMELGLHSHPTTATPIENFHGMNQVGPQVPRLTHVKQDPTFEPQSIITTWFIFIKVGSWLFHVKNPRDLCWALRPTFCCTQLSTQVPSLAFKKGRHVDIHVILGT